MATRRDTNAFCIAIHALVQLSHFMKWHKLQNSVWMHRGFCVCVCGSIGKYASTNRMAKSAPKIAKGQMFVPRESSEVAHFFWTKHVHIWHFGCFNQQNCHICWWPKGIECIGIEWHATTRKVHIKQIHDLFRCAMDYALKHNIMYWWCVARGLCTAANCASFGTWGNFQFGFNICNFPSLSTKHNGLHWVDDLVGCKMQKFS